LTIKEPITLPMRRDAGIDALRSIAIVAMMAAHASRLIARKDLWVWSTWVMLLEPLIPTLFLTLVGVSLFYSFGRCNCSPWMWYRRQLLRALGLWLISALFFALEKGIRLPDMFVASGILCTIAYTIVITGLLLITSKSTTMLVSALVAGSLVYLLLDRQGLNPFLIVSGNSPMLPLLLFAVWGVLWVRIKPASPYYFIIEILIYLSIGAWLLHVYGFVDLFSKPVGRSNASRLLAAPVFGGDLKRVAFYNIRPDLALFCFCVHGIALRTSRLLLGWTGKVAQAVLLFGRHSLEMYIVHLLCFALLVVWGGKRPLHSGEIGTLVLISVMVICWWWGYWRESGWWQRKTKVAQ